LNIPSASNAHDGLARVDFAASFCQQGLDHPSAGSLDLMEHFHGLDDAQHCAGFDLLADCDEGRLSGGWSQVQDAVQR
jgi:hypothetical protein